MKRGQLTDENVLVQEGIAVLMKALGPIETDRFLAHTFGHREESVTRHRKWQSKLNKKNFLDDVLKK